MDREVIVSLPPFSPLSFSFSLPSLSLQVVTVLQQAKPSIDTWDTESQETRPPLHGTFRLGDLSWEVHHSFILSLILL